MAAVSHNARVLKSLRDDGYFAQVVERWDSFSRKKHDLFGIIDVLAIGNCETLAIQVTSRSNGASRRTKMQAAPELQSMVDAGWRVQLWLFDKPTTRWRKKVEDVTPT